MLTLTRSIGQAMPSPRRRLVIDGQVTLTVLAIKGSRVRLGINAPHGTTIRRQEAREPRQPAPTDPGGSH